MGALIEASRICKRYNQKSNNMELKETSLSIEKGKIYVIEGKSGAGKSTLLNILGGMEKPTSGKVYYKGKSFYDLKDSDQAAIRGEKYGFVFQSFQLIPELTVKENIELPLIFTNRQEKMDKIAELARHLGIENQLHKLPDFLSGGEQQRVAIARALITEPEIIFADEPTGNLDSATTKKIIHLFTRLCNEKNITLVVVTHEKNLFEFPDNLFLVKNGRLQVAQENV
ncbi:ABC transporter ATP-binding protein [Heyndrickxia coagulans]|uniref:ABC transporter ATP-binding protein n=2 Tax=Bacillati TaxID=1783272 RepID=UPI002E1B0436|nr:ABC transporter ATP-binding protein [Heyndrickxia coagulans]